MNKLNFIIILLLLVCGMSSCKKPAAPKYLGYQNFRIQKAGLNNTILAADAKIYNPNRYDLQLKSASVDVYINNSFLGHSAIESLTILPGRDTSYIPLRLEAAAKDILRNAATLFFNPEVKLKINGTAKAGRSGFFINIPIDYEGTQHIELK